MAVTRRIGLDWAALSDQEVAQNIEVNDTTGGGLFDLSRDSQRQPTLKWGCDYRLTGQKL